MSFRILSAAEGEESLAIIDFSMLSKSHSYQFKPLELTITSFVIPVKNRNPELKDSRLLWE